MPNIDEVKRIAQEAADRAAERVSARFEEVRQDVRTSDEWGTWKGLPAKWRRIIPAAICFALVLGYVIGASVK